MAWPAMAPRAGRVAEWFRSLESRGADNARTSADRRSAASASLVWASTSSLVEEATPARAETRMARGCSSPRAYVKDATLLSDSASSRPLLGLRKDQQDGDWSCPLPAVSSPVDARVAIWDAKLLSESAYSVLPVACCKLHHGDGAVCLSSAATSRGVDHATFAELTQCFPPGFCRAQQGGVESRLMPATPSRDLPMIAPAEDGLWRRVCAFALAPESHCGAVPTPTGRQRGDPAELQDGPPSLAALQGRGAW